MVGGMAKLLVDDFWTRSKAIAGSFECLSAHPRSTCPVRTCSSSLSSRPRIVVGLATVCRYVHEAVELPAALAPDLAEAIRTAARVHGIVDALTAADIPCRADKTCRGASGPIRIPYRGKWHDLSPGQQAVNRSHARIRALGERAVATPKTWRLLRGLRCSTTRITDLIRAILALHLNAG